MYNRYVDGLATALPPIRRFIASAACAWPATVMSL
jgi:hypothetical protein